MNSSGAIDYAPEQVGVKREERSEAIFGYRSNATKDERQGGILGFHSRALEGCGRDQDPRRRFREEIELAIVSETKATNANARMTTTTAPTLLVQQK
jgi:hypothetical protein